MKKGVMVLGSKVSVSGTALEKNLQNFSLTYNNPQDIWD